MSFISYSEGEDVVLKKGTWTTNVIDTARNTEVRVIGRNEPERQPSALMVKKFKNSAKQINKHMDVVDRMRRKLEERRK
jgi:hypothetical protein